MKNLIILLSLFFFTSCNKTEKTVVTMAPSGASLDSNLRMRWGSSNPVTSLTLSVSTSFSAGEKTLFEQMAKEWDDNSSQTFFIQGSGTPTFSDTANIDNGNLDSFYESSSPIFGIYKSYNWFSDVGSTALAITQYFGNRRNSGTANEYLELSHADIIVNYKNFVFRTGAYTANTYDLPTVVLHELGHLLGLRHNTNQLSIMYPSIGTSTVQRVLASVDQSSIANNYSFATSLTASASAAAMLDPDSVRPEGESVRGRIELMSNGECNHYVNGKLSFTHKINTPK